MFLKEALRRVIKICPKGRDQALFRAVRFVAGSGTSPAYVYASDGVCFFSVPVEDDLFDILIASEGIATAVKDSGRLYLDRAQDGTVSLLGNRTRYQLVASDNLEFFPAHPWVPQAMGAFPWTEVSRVVHASPKETEGSAVAVVRFTPQYVEAFDQVRLARVEIKTPWIGFVPRRAFLFWPSGEAQVAFTEHHAFFKIGEEVRSANLVNNPSYPDTDKLAARIEGGGSFLSSVMELQKVVKAAVAVSPIGLVMLEAVLPDLLRVVACDVKGPIKLYEGWATAAAIAGTPGVATVDGKLLLQALKECATPKVKLVSGDNVDPLRLESGSLVECIWQRYWA